MAGIEHKTECNLDGWQSKRWAKSGHVQVVLTVPSRVCCERAFLCFFRVSPCPIYLQYATSTCRVHELALKCSHEAAPRLPVKVKPVNLLLASYFVIKISTLPACGYRFMTTTEGVASDRGPSVGFQARCCPSLCTITHVHGTRGQPSF